jgi:hypothetical protein
MKKKKGIIKKNRIKKEKEKREKNQTKKIYKNFFNKIVNIRV